MEIKLIKDSKKDFLDLLLLADPQEDMIDKYLSNGIMFALFDNDLKGVCVVLQISDNECELKNLATYEKYHGQGYGSKLVKYVLEYYKNRCNIMFVGTDIQTMNFYKKCGFEYSHIQKNFFLDNYSEAIFENGEQLIDMIYLRKDLK